MKREMITMDEFGRITVPTFSECVDERSGTVGAVRSNRPDTSCHYPSCVQVRSIETFRIGKTYQVA